MIARVFGNYLFVIGDEYLGFEALLVDLPF